MIDGRAAFLSKHLNTCEWFCFDFFLSSLAFALESIERLALFARGSHGELFRRGVQLQKVIGR